MFAIYSFRQRSATYIHDVCVFVAPSPGRTSPIHYVFCPLFRRTPDLTNLLWLDTTSCESRWQLATYIFMKIYHIWICTYIYYTYVYIYISTHIHSLYEVWQWEPGHSWCFPRLVGRFLASDLGAGGHFNPAISCANALSTGKVGSLTRLHLSRAQKVGCCRVWGLFRYCLRFWVFYLGIIKNYPVICCIQGMKYYPFTIIFNRNSCFSPWK